MRNWQKSLIVARLSAALVLVVLAVCMTPTRAQSPSRAAVKEPATTKRAEGPTIDQEQEPRTGQMPEELELLELQIETERAQLRLAESRLDQAKRWEALARELVHSGRLPLEQLIATQDGNLMRESDLVAQKAALKEAELRLTLAQKGTSSNWSLSCPSEGRLADMERRLAEMERTVRRLRQDTEHVLLDLPIKMSSSRR
jgi:hypothetical protein